MKLLLFIAVSVEAVTFSVQPQNTVAGTTFSVTVNNLLGAGGAHEVSIVWDNWVLYGNTGPISQTGTDKDFVFTGLSVRTAGTGFKLIAFADKSDTATSVQSNTFDITSGSATALEFGAVSGGTVLTNQSVTVTAKDDYGNTDTSFTSTVTVESTAGTTSNNTPTAATAGQVTYSTIQVSKSGDQQFKATGNGLTGYSAEFTMTAGIPNSITIEESGTVLATCQAFTLTGNLLDSGLNNPTVTSKDVTVSKNSGPGDLFGSSLTATANSDGEYTISDLSFDEPGTYTINVTCPCDGANVSDTRTITVSGTSAVSIGWINNFLVEGGTETYNVELLNRPCDDVTIAVSSSDTGKLTVDSGSSLTFTPTDYGPKTVTVTAVSAASEGDTVTISHTPSSSDASFDSAAPPDFVGTTATVSGSGALTVRLTPSTKKAAKVEVEGPNAVSNLGTLTYKVGLSVAPAGSVTVTPTYDNTHISISPSSATYTTGDFAQKDFTITVNNNDKVFNTPVQITHSIVTSNNDDNAFTTQPTTYEVTIIVTAGQHPEVIISESPVFNEGETGEYQIYLGSSPDSDVEIGISNDNTAEITVTTTGAFTNKLVFTPGNYYIPQKVAAVAVVGTSSRGLTYDATISHTVTTSDVEYNASGIFRPSANVIVTVMAVCEPGWYSWPPGEGNCNVCPTGASCDEIYLEDASCSTGKYSLLQDPLCYDCPEGHECSTGSPERCPDGSKPDGTSNACTSCGAGKICAEGIESVDCGAGTIGSGDGSCSICLPGNECTDTTTQTPCGGTEYAFAGSASCTTCPDNVLCNSDVAQFYQCGLGYTSTNGGACTSCPAGQSCSGAATTGTPCTVGFYSPDGIDQCIQCPIGYKCDSGYSFPLTCAVGTYNTAIGQSTCTAILKGTHSIRGFAAIDCIPGEASANDADVCERVLVGKKAKGWGQDDDASTIDCTAGKYCPVPWIGEQPCPLGTYSTTDSYACTFCDPGKICNPESTSATGTVNCPEGYYCAQHLTRNFAHHFKNPCPPGTVGANADQAQSTACVLVEVKKAAYVASQTGINCAPGHYCLEGSPSEVHFFCSAGFKNDEVAVQVGGPADCIACSTAGKWCQKTSFREDACPAGAICIAGAQVPEKCPFGTENPDIDKDLDTDCSACADGFFCPQGSILQHQCIAGTFNNITDKNSLYTSCTLCTEQFACPLTGMTAANVACAEGHVCPTGTHWPDEWPCMAGYDMQRTDMKSYITDCQATECPSGSYCVLGTSDNRNLKRKCKRGQICLQGAAYSHEDPCPEGTYNIELNQDVESTDCTACDTGRWCRMGSPYLSGLCAQGHYCPLNSTRATLNECSAGTYTASSRLTAQGDCSDCPAGSYCYSGSIAPIPCPPGSYNTNENVEGPGPSSSASTTECMACPAGSKCPEGSAATQNCGQGYYSAAGQFDCEICPAGYKCDGDNITFDNVNPAGGNANICAAGQWCPEGSSSETPCAAGHYCDSGTTEQVPCAPGKKRENPGGANVGECVDADGGEYTLPGSAVETGKCEPGYYCPIGSNGPFAVPCPEGTIAITAGNVQQSNCSDCPGGSYCPLGSGTAIICPVGSYCTSPSTQPTLCPAGTYGRTEGLALLTDCTDCDAGSYCSQPGLVVPDGQCESGYSCPAGSSSATPSSSTGVCAAGGYCEPGFGGVQRDCPAGTYNPDTGATAVTWCQQCPNGYFCDGNEITLADSDKCSAGYYCTGGAYSAQQYPAQPGTYTALGASSEIQCSIPQFNDLYGQSDCKYCDAGYYCDVEGMSIGKYCPAGSYCEQPTALNPAPADAYPFACPIGRYNPIEMAEASSDCILCRPGAYCETTGLSTPTETCWPGHFCYEGAQVKNADTASGNQVTDQQGECPVGHYCPGGTVEPIPCASGKYRIDIKAFQEGDCVTCGAGKYCTDAGADSVQGDCDEGYYCYSGSRIARPNENGATKHYCEKGSYCPSGSEIAQTCNPGTYQNKERQADCDQCPAGFYCTSGQGELSSSEYCPIGYYCPAGTKTANQNKCAAGYYSPPAKDDSDTDVPSVGKTIPEQCTPCDPGKYCTQGQADNDYGTVQGDCDDGYFCKLGSSLSNPQATGDGDSQGGVCTPGYYCPVNAAFRKLCDGGKYCLTGLLTAVSGPCNAGYYCPGGAVSASPSDKICLPGYFCEQGVDSLQPCARGTYSSADKNESQGDCEDCPSGQYCSNYDDTPSNAINGSCAEGFFCAGTNYEQYPKDGKCPVGKFCESGEQAVRCDNGFYQDRTMQGACKICPRGYYCYTDPLSAVGPATKVKCQAGTYCPEGSSAEIPCPAGTFNNLVGRFDLTDCYACPPGHFCTEGSTAGIQKNVSNVVTNLCKAGYYCRGSAATEDPTDGSTGDICPKGFYCAAGASTPMKCIPGHYCAGTGNVGTWDTTNECNAGYYCVEESSTATPTDGTSGSFCTRGHYCEQGTAHPVPCPRGTYRSSSGATQLGDCAKCPDGQYCSDLGATTIKGLCASGYYCPDNGLTVGWLTDKPEANICDEGHYCTIGATAMLDCLAGTYQPYKGQSTCITCPAGFTCDLGAVNPVECPIGHRCPEGSATATIVPCENGKYQPFKGQGSCLNCPRGKKCGAYSGTPVTPVDCDVGRYCEENTSDPAPYCKAGRVGVVSNLYLKDQCRYCDIGKYCTILNSDQAIGSQSYSTGDCNAGYYCESGSDRADPDGYANTGRANPCPAGGYCTVGTHLPTPCNSGTFRRETGGTTQDDCSACEEGYYCIENDPIPKLCYPGAFCPAGSNKPTNCIRGTYSRSYKAKNSLTCLLCPAGYNCWRDGASNYRYYPCTPGFYCPENTGVGAQMTVSPAGRYSPTNSAGSASDCLNCPSGYFCEEQSTTYDSCFEWSNCPAGSSQENNCPGGAYCYAHTSNPVTCPKGWFCPQYVDDQGYSAENVPPYKCDANKICPTGSKYQQSCPGWQITNKALTIFEDAEPECIDCPLGQYAYNNTDCINCPSGYMCKAENYVRFLYLEDLLIENIITCDKGFLCPEGSFEQTACPPGQYGVTAETPDDLGNLTNSCEICPVNTFSDTEGNFDCESCGDFARSDAGSQTCKPIGDNRIFIKTDKSVPCERLHEDYDDDGEERTTNSNDDCVQKVIVRCENSQIRSEDNECVDADDCSEPCKNAGGKGERTTGFGICNCDEVDDVNEVCSVSCRNDSPVVQIAGNEIKVYDPLGNDGAGETIYKKISELDCMTGNLDCIENSDCRAFSVSMPSQGGFLGQYNKPLDCVAELVTRWAPPAEEETSRRMLEYEESIGGISNTRYNATHAEFVQRRQLQDDVAVDPIVGINNPVICLNLGESIFWSVSPESFPKYEKDSLLNSNEKFDYGEIENMKTLMEGSSTNKPSTFGFTFNEAGIYLFSDSANDSQHMIVGVMDASTKCPYDDTNIQPRTMYSLTAIGAKLEDDVILEVNWRIIMYLMLVLFIAIIVFIALFYYYTKITWNFRVNKKAHYRNQNKNIDAQSVMGNRLRQSLIISGDGDSSDDELASGHSSEEEDIQKMMFSSVPDVVNFEPGDYVDANDDLDPQIVKAIMEKINENNLRMMEGFNKSAENSRQIQEQLMDEVKDLFEYLDGKLNPLKPKVNPYGPFPGSDEPVADYEVDPDKEWDPEEIPPSVIFANMDPEAPILEQVDAGQQQRALAKISQDKDLVEADKQKLMTEYNSNLQNIQEKMGGVKTKSEDDIRRRLAERAAKRKQLMEQKNSLDKQLKSKKEVYDDKKQRIKMAEITVEQEVNDEAKNEKYDARVEILAETQQAVEAKELQQRMQLALEENPEQKDQIMDEYEKRMKMLEQNLSMNQMRQNQENLKRIEERRKARLAQRKEQLKTDEEQLDYTYNLEVQRINNLKEEIEISEAVEELMPAIKEEEDKEFIQELVTKQAEEAAELHEELRAEDHRITLTSRKTIVQEAEAQMDEAQTLEERRAALQLQIDQAADSDEKERLIKDLADVQNSMDDAMRKHQNDQQKKLADRLAARRALAAKKKELAKKQEEERDRLQADKEEAKATKSNSDLADKLQARVGGLDVDQRLKAAQEILHEKHEREKDTLSDKLAQQLKHRQACVVEDVLSAKADTLRAMRSDFKERRRVLNQRKLDLGRKQYEDHMKLIDDSENEMINKIDYDAMKDLESQQDKLWKEHQEENMQKFNALINKQLTEMREMMGRMGANEDKKAQLEKEMIERKEKMEDDNRGRMDEIENEKSKLKELHEAKQKELEEAMAIEQAREDHKRQQVRRAEERREQMKKEEEFMKSLQGKKYTEADMRKLMSDFQKEQESANAAKDKERSLQQSRLNSKLAEKRAKKQAQRENLDRYRKEQEQWQEQLRLAPQLNHKEANYLLNRWRQHPKKGAEDIEKSLKQGQPRSVMVPEPREITHVGEKIERDRIEEIIKRVQTVEKYAKSVDTEKFHQALTAVQDVQKLLGQFKSD